eukprot:TRINITY_DN5953_c0_g1_i2.p1 TRINITY_DN5953_c0_g1~~TRINITY_DN5953_c0_g1_i2.p1  ORF type:complete len:318 (+),score=103.40 TRINITY_DN5953_c0_g1_i2:424-1377(+)
MESEAQLTLKNREILQLKEELMKLKGVNDTFTSDGTTVDMKRYKLLEEERNTLRKQMNDIWKTLEEKESRLVTVENELKKLEEYKSKSERYKQQKNEITEERQKFMNLSKTLELQVKELRQENDALQASLKKEREARGAGGSRSGEPFSMTEIRELFQAAKTSLDDLRKGMSKVKDEGNEGIEELRKRLEEKDNEIIELKIQLKKQLHSQSATLKEQFAEEMASLNAKYEAELNSQHEAYEKKLKELREIVRKAKDKDDNLVEQDVLQRLKERVVNLESEINDLKNEKKYISDLKQRSDEEKNKLLNELKDLSLIHI